MPIPTDRPIHNLEKIIYSGTGRYRAPLMDPSSLPAADLLSREWIGFNFATNCPDPQDHIVHFFVDDYQFERVWKDPVRYTDMLKKFYAVVAPDFSMFVDWPDAVNIYNHYRKQWLSCWWQDHGVRVIPDLCWTIDPSSYEWCFDGIPAGSQVCVTTLGGFGRGTRSHALLPAWLDGYHAALERLRPSSMIIFGAMPDDASVLEADGMELINVPNRRMERQRRRGKANKTT